MTKTTNVGLAESRVTRIKNEVLSVIGLGSSVAVVLYDTATGIAGLAHVMLPRAVAGESASGKYADTAVPLLLTEMIDHGAEAKTVRAGVFGGASLLGQGHSLLLDLGQRTVEAAEAALAKAGVDLLVADVGGSKGRNLSIEVATGQVTVRMLGFPEQVHAELATHPEVQP
jgi:chemotaxis protein CheD